LLEDSSLCGAPPIPCEMLTENFVELASEYSSMDRELAPGPKVSLESLDDSGANSWPGAACPFGNLLHDQSSAAADAAELFTIRRGKAEEPSRGSLPADCWI